MVNSSTISYEQQASDPTATMEAPPKLPSNLLQQLKRLPLPQLIEVIQQLPAETVLALTYDWEFWARPSQLEPSQPWVVWMLLTGRGFGKTRTGAETLRKYVDEGRAKAIALVAPTAADVRDTMLGLKPGSESGLLQVCPPWDRPLYRPSYRECVWPTSPRRPNGASATMFSGEEPNRLRGPQHDMAWWDEPAATPSQDEVEAMLLFGLRLGEAKLIMTGTPLPVPMIQRIRRDAKNTLTNPALGTFVTTGTMYDNTFLAPSAIAVLKRKYEGTRMGRQEIYGEVLDDNPDALWSQGMIDNYAITPGEFATRVRSGELRLMRGAVSVDPAVTANKKSNQTGIVNGFIDQQNPPHAYIVGDFTLSASPSVWARTAIRVLKGMLGDRIIGEVNNGGDMVENTIRQEDPNVPFTSVRATRGKILRAEPVSALYEQGRVHHVRLPGPADPEVDGNPNHLVDLEYQMTTYDGSQESPDRLDALVWLVTNLIVDQETDAEQAIAYLERRSAQCVECRTLNYMPPGQLVVFCRQCRAVIHGTAVSTPDLAAAVSAFPQGATEVPREPTPSAEELEREEAYYDSVEEGPVLSSIVRPQLVEAASANSTPARAPLRRDSGSSGVPGLDAFIHGARP